MNRTKVAVGEPVGVTVTVRNVGDASGTYRAILTGDMTILRTAEVRLAPGESHTFAWSVSFAEPSPQVRLFEHYRFIGDVQVTAATPSPTPTPLPEPATATVTSNATPTAVGPTTSPVSPSPSTTTSPPSAMSRPSGTPGTTATADSPATTQAVGGSSAADGTRRSGPGFDYRYLLLALMAAALVLVVVRRAGL